MVTFLGFPLGGFAAGLIVGAIDGPVPALLGGLITGAILGAVQLWGLGRHRPGATRWIAATALGLVVGLGIGAAAVDYATDLSALVVQGAISGLAVGAAQAVVLAAAARPAGVRLAARTRRALGRRLGDQHLHRRRVDEQFTVFGSSGAIVVTALTAVLPVAVNREAPS